MKKLPKKMRKMFKDAGFSLWGDETWGPGKGRIDWSCDYSLEMADLVRMIIKECVDEAFHQTGDKRVRSKISKRFGYKYKEFQEVELNKKILKECGRKRDK